MADLLGNCKEIVDILLYDWFSYLIFVTDATNKFMSGVSFSRLDAKNAYSYFMGVLRYFQVFFNVLAVKFWIQELCQCKEIKNNRSVRFMNILLSAFFD